MKKTERESVYHLHLLQTATLLCRAVLLVVLSSGIVAHVSAAEAESDAVPEASPQPNGDQPEDTRSQDQQSTPDRPLSGSEQRRANDKGGIFRPSESISEDLSITFPVDI